MTAPAIRVPVNADKDVTEAVRQLQEFARVFNGIPFLKGRLIDNVAVTNTAFDLNHGLGRSYQGYLIVRCYGAEFTLFEATSQPDPARYIRLTASANSTGALWVF